LKPELIN